MRLVVLFSLIGLGLGCSRAPASGEPSVTAAGLVGPRWRLIELEGQPPVAGAAERQGHLIFSRTNGRDVVGGTTGCNHVGGQYQVDGDRIRFTDLGVTRMFCPDDGRMRQETQFLEALTRADRFAIAGDTLTLSAGETVVMRFVRS